MRVLSLILVLAACTDKDTTTGDSATTDDTGTTTSDTGTTTSDTGTTDAVDLDDDGSPADEDCNDEDPAVHPGATEVCDDDDTDEDCNDLADDDDPGLDPASATLWPVDADGDGHGDPDATVSACDEPADTPTVSDDCDDTQATVYPGAEEICSDGVDNDCDETENTCGIYGDAPVADTYTLRIDGGEDSYVGVALAFAGDMNGDGVGDILVGDPKWDGADGDEGSAYIVYGGVTGTLDLATQADVTLRGQILTTNAGATVDGGGDFDGDGVADLLIGAPLSSVGREDYAYVLYGPVTTDGGLEDISDAKYSEYNNAGTDLAHADMDGDGTDDWLISSLVGGGRDDPGYGGNVHVVLGGTRHSGAQELSEVSDHELYGEYNYAHFGGNGQGRELMDAGDVNGDGVADLFVGCYSYHDFVARNYLFLGPLPASPTIASDADWIVSSTGSSPHADGLLLSDDLDGDGYGDALLGQGDDDETVVYSGAATWSGTTDTSTRDYSLYTTEYSHPGTSVSTGDLDGDGVLDVVLGDQYHDDYRGGFWAIYGPLTASVDLTAGAAASTVGLRTGDETSRMGRQALTGSDINGDGLDDVLLGSEYYHHSAYLFYGEGL